MLRLTCIVDDKAGSPAVRAEHGLAVLAETANGGLLWDTGPSGEILLHNWDTLGLANRAPQAIALSHAHLDHTGGLATMLKRYPGLPVYAHAELGQPRFSVRDSIYASGLILQLEALAALAELHLSGEPQEILSGVTTTGTIAPRPYPTGGSPHLHTLAHGRLVPDPYADDMSLVLDSDGGVVLLCGCCHAGLRNTIGAVRRLTAAPLRAVVGGTHLVDAEPPELDAIVHLLEAEGRPALYLNHCTGQKAIDYLARAYRGSVAPFPGGTSLTF